MATDHYNADSASFPAPSQMFPVRSDLTEASLLQVLNLGTALATKASSINILFIG